MRRFAEHLAATSLRLDVCSLGELMTAERGGFPAGRMYFHGCGKTDAELQAIVDRRVAFDVVDNAEELERLAALAAREQRGGEFAAPVDVMLRVNTGIEAHTHDFVRTGGENTKFGVPPAGCPALFARIAELPQLRLIGLHAHIGSQIVESEPFLANLDELLAASRGAIALGLPVGELICGGGIGVEEGPADPRPIDLDVLAARLAERAAGSGLRLAHRAGPRASRASGDVALPGHGGEAPRPPPLRRRRRRPDRQPAPDALRCASRPRGHGGAQPGPDEPATLAGRSCENDEMGDYVLPADLRAGDLVALRTTGAYTYSMASNYNRFGRPPVVFVRDGHHRRVIRGESADDVMRHDVD